MNLNNVSNGYADITVDIIDFAKDMGKHIWDCYKMTWHNLQNVEYDQNNPEIIEAVKNVIGFKALPMPREQALITFRINNISRVCLAQITRQRKAAFNVESQMPQAVTHNVIVPLNIWENAKFKSRAIELCETSQKLYNDMIDEGIPFQDARYMLIHGQTTSCAYVVDINTFCGSFGMRCENNLSDEINLVYRLCLNALVEKLIACYHNNEIDSLTYLFYLKILETCDCMGAKQKRGMNIDKVFGNSFDRFVGGNEEVAQATINCTCDFKKSAWYLELIRLYESKPELLFEGEKEMIERWIGE